MFSETLGIAKRRRLNEEVVACQERIREAFPEDPPARRGARLAISILGHDALVGTLGLSLHAHLLALGEDPLCARPFPAVPTHTGVPHIRREALADAPLGDNGIRAGETVKVMLDSFQGMPDAWRQRFFGAGLHLCLGRPLSLAFLAQLSAFLGTLTTRVAVQDFRLRKDDVFSIPEAFTVEVLP
jgi:hypothetical protein